MVTQLPCHTLWDIRSTNNQRQTIGHSSAINVRRVSTEIMTSNGIRGSISQSSHSLATIATRASLAKTRSRYVPALICVDIALANSLHSATYSSKAVVKPWLRVMTQSEKANRPNLRRLTQNPIPRTTYSSAQPSLLLLMYYLLFFWLCCKVSTHIFTGPLPSLQVFWLRFSRLMFIGLPPRTFCTWSFWLFRTFVRLSLFADSGYH